MNSLLLLSGVLPTGGHEGWQDRSHACIQKTDPKRVIRQKSDNRTTNPEVETGLQPKGAGFGSRAFYYLQLKSNFLKIPEKNIEASSN